MAQRHQPHRGQGAGEWKSGLFSCCEDCGDCIFAWFCHCCYRYKLAQEAGEGTGCAIISFLFPLALCCIRGKIREQKGIDGSAVGDFFTIWLCNLCAAVQMHKEVS